MTEAAVDHATPRVTGPRSVDPRIAEPPADTTVSSSPSPSPTDGTAERNGGIRRVDLDITGMSCASCVQRIERKLGKLDGVTATVNLPLESAAVQAPASVTDEDLLAVVDKAGYAATVRSPAGRPANEVTETGTTGTGKRRDVSQGSAAGRAGRPSTDGTRHSPAGDGGGTRPAPTDDTAPAELTDHGARAADQPIPAHRADHATHGPSEDALKPRLIVAAILNVPLFLISMVPALQFPHWGWVAFALATPVAFWAAWPFHRAAFRAARHGSSTMDTLVSLGVLAAWGFSTVELFLDPGMTAMAGAGHGGMASMADHQLYYETAGVITTFLLLGRWLEARAKRRAGQALKSLLDLGAKTATVLRDGVETTVPAAELVPGDEFVVRPGEKFATDGYVLSGHSAIDTSLVTGESVPVEAGPDDTVTGATVNTSGRLLVRATRVGSDTTLAQMGRLVSEAQTGKAPIARLADRISAVFVPIVLVIAVLTFAGWMLFSGDLHAAFRAAVAVLVIACPCALGLATPVGLLAGTGRASQLGILIRGPEVLEDTRTVDTVVLDKTGTVTEGVLAVTDVAVLDAGSGIPGGRGAAVSAAAGISPDDGRVTTVDGTSRALATLDADAVLRLAGVVESHSEHPIAAAIVDAARDADRAAGGAGDVADVVGFASAAGGGVKGTVIDSVTGHTHAVAAGRTSYLRAEYGEDVLTREDLARLDAAEAAGATAVWVAVDGRPAGIISLQDTIKESSARAITELRQMGLRPILLTGDNAQVAARVAAAVGISGEDVYAGVRPEDKVATVIDLQDAGRVVAMVGDGVNDAPALAQADLSIAMGSGTDVAREASDITVMGSSLEQVVQAVQLSRKTLGIIKSNLFWAFAYNTLGIPVAAFGLLNPMVAGAAMAASSVLVVANSLRLTRFAR